MHNNNTYSYQLTLSNVVVQNYFVLSTKGYFALGYYTESLPKSKIKIYKKNIYKCSQVKHGFPY